MRLTLGECLKCYLMSFCVSLLWSGAPSLRSRCHRASAVGKAALLGCGFSVSAARSTPIAFLFTGVNSNCNSIASGFVGLNTTGDVSVCLRCGRNQHEKHPVPCEADTQCFLPGVFQRHRVCMTVTLLNCKAES